MGTPARSSGGREPGTNGAWAWLRSPPGLSAVAAAWLLSLGIDFLLHGGILARLYTGMEEDPFLLPPERAFARIPLGYVAFLVLTVGLGWLCARLGATSARAGARVGLVAGLLVWGGLGLGLYSISTARLDLLAGWTLGQSAELAGAGAVFGAALGGTPRGRLWRRVGAAVAACVVVALVLQATGLAPASELR